MVTKR